ncbi:lysosomal cobalamin transport escort protein LMBD1 [Hypomesus transpacificus]|uniref:lysosomal cobalamin transport escort protein LMBD1 n=1 Tax=Hypomesus transpacificus TaxID=137520 RepID=UPI001F0819C3|nr:lysosomal cobalamin transport escort protein LMBD1 [Hypomesus transpacificus]
MADLSLISESALGWTIFTFVLLVILVFCWVYIRKYQSRQESEVISTITAICALAIALITSALLPVDIFLVSYMKNPNGTYKDWAANNETRGHIEDTVLYGYYSECLFTFTFSRRSYPERLRDTASDWRLLEAAG